MARKSRGKVGRRAFGERGLVTSSDPGWLSHSLDLPDLEDPGRNVATCLGLL